MKAATFLFVEGELVDGFEVEPQRLALGAAFHVRV